MIRTSDDHLLHRGIGRDTEHDTYRAGSSDVCRRAGATLTTLLALVLGACEQPAPPEPVALRVENESLNLLFTDAPEGLELELNDDSRIELAPVEPDTEPATEQPDTDPSRRLWVEAGDVSEFGIQLVEIVNSQRAEFEALPSGSYSGAREVQVPLAGTAYYVRGQFEDAGERQEELRVFLIHPSQNRLVTFHSRYRDGGAELSAERVGELLEWVAEMEPLRSYEQLQEQEAAAASDEAAG